METITLETFKEICRKAKNFEAAFKKAKELKDVPELVSNSFYLTYAREGNTMLSLKEAFNKFYNEVINLKS